MKKSWVVPGHVTIIIFVWHWLPRWLFQHTKCKYSNWFIYFLVRRNILLYMREMKVIIKNKCWLNDDGTSGRHKTVTVINWFCARAYGWSGHGVGQIARSKCYAVLFFRTSINFTNLNIPLSPRLRLPSVQAHWYLIAIWSVINKNSFYTWQFAKCIEQKYS